MSLITLLLFSPVGGFALHDHNNCVWLMSKYFYDFDNLIVDTKVRTTLTIKKKGRYTEHDPAAATDSSGVASTIERSPLDFALEAGASDKGTVAPEMPPSEDVPATDVPGAGQAEETATTDPLAAPESRKRGRDGTDVNAPPKSLRRDHADPRPSGSSRGRKSLAAIQLGLASIVFVPEDARAGVSDPDPLSVADPPSRHPADVTQVLLRRETRSLRMLLSLLRSGLLKVYTGRSEVLSMVAFLTPQRHVATLKQQVSGEVKQNAAFEKFKRQQDDRVEQRCVEMDARLDALSIDFDEELYPHMLTAIAGRRWVIGRGLRLAVMKCGESLELRQAFADVALKDLKYPLADQLESLTDAPMDVIMAAMYLESDTEDDAPPDIRDLRPNSSQLTIPVYPEVRDPRNPWASKVEMVLADTIAANISRAEKKKKCRIVCRTHGVGSAHHARSDGVPLSAPTVVPQGLAFYWRTRPHRQNLKTILKLCNIHSTACAMSCMLHESLYSYPTS
nr:hypothetical protein [Tanacetum cinerariifolium]